MIHNWVRMTGRVTTMCHNSNGISSTLAKIACSFSTGPFSIQQPLLKFKDAIDFTGSKYPFWQLIRHKLLNRLVIAHLSTGLIKQSCSRGPASAHRNTITIQYDLLMRVSLGSSLIIRTYNNGTDTQFVG